ncbi:hypothetical protein AND_001101 [Anopheles darlingi]|uniref:Uncharacterized protein n=1 Tax=Anopheles darlingi TaxID=43151 RepID=W5JRR9_ANODA|nr:hypothetical protein AND_001101 [Anopheles darlingi]
MAADFSAHDHRTLLAVADEDCRLTLAKPRDSEPIRAMLRKRADVTTMSYCLCANDSGNHLPTAGAVALEYRTFHRTAPVPPEKVKESELSVSFGVR